ncbi:MAG TPA: glycosyltransferase family 2 protein [Candidatus Solibacter sp.]|nr:glycosyltransferase family 2 protein [Candidatus Solibacter sp.]
MMEMVELLTPGLLILICLCLLGAGAGRVALLLEGAIEARRQRANGTDDNWATLLRSDLVPAVAVIAAPPDASEPSRRFVRRLLNLHAGNPEIVLVLDGPSDAEMEVWKREFHLQPTSRLVNPGLKTKPVRALYVSSESIQLVVVDKGRGGRADCLNTGINVANAPVIATVDADAQFIEESLLRLLRPMLADPDRTVAVCAVAPGASEPGLPARFYRLGFLRTWLGRCAGLAASNTFLPAPGCFLMLSREAVLRIGGFQAGPLEMVIHLHALERAAERPYRIVFIPEPMSRPSAPRQYGAVRRAQARDQMEVGAALRFHKALVLGFGSLGWLAIPGLLASRLLLPLMETAGLVLGAAAMAAGWIAPGMLALLVAAPLVCEILVSMTAVLLEQLASEANAEPLDVAALFFSAIAENLGYRQWKNLWMVRDLFRGYRAAALGTK